jgi:hypothetical protein
MWIVPNPLARTRDTGQGERDSGIGKRDTGLFVRHSSLLNVARVSPPAIHMSCHPEHASHQKGQQKNSRCYQEPPINEARKCRGTNEGAGNGTRDTEPGVVCAPLLTCHSLLLLRPRRPRRSFHRHSRQRSGLVNPTTRASSSGGALPPKENATGNQTELRPAPANSAPLQTHPWPGAHSADHASQTSAIPIRAGHPQERQPNSSCLFQ